MRLQNLKKLFNKIFINDKFSSAYIFRVRKEIEREEIKKAIKR